MKHIQYTEVTTSVPECHVNGMWKGVGRASGGFWLVSPFPPPQFRTSCSNKVWALPWFTSNFSKPAKGFQANLFRIQYTFDNNLKQWVSFPWKLWTSRHTLQKFALVYYLLFKTLFEPIQNLLNAKPSSVKKREEQKAVRHACISLKRAARNFNFHITDNHAGRHLATLVSRQNSQTL
jgi:hypothetical protein